MGLFGPTRRPDQIVSENEFRAMEMRARLLPSKSANFIQVVGILVLIFGVLAFFGSPSVGVVGVVSGGFIIAAGHLQQTVYDIRTLMLRNRSEAEDRRISDA